MQRPLKYLYYITIIFITGILIGCARNSPADSIISGKADIFPDYCDITIPANIAPLNFRINEKADKYIVRFHGENDRGFIVKSTDGSISIPEKNWKKILITCQGRKLIIDIFYRQNGQWKYYDPITNHVAKDPIDGYLIYRLIEPGYETWNKMGIYQRCLESFDESPVMINDLSDGNCMNCHSFCGNNSETMLFHVRAQHAGTILVRNGTIIKVNTNTDSTISAGVYPSWHPEGRYVAFSVNRIVQSFHALPNKRIEVIDTLSDLILYDAENNRVLKKSTISSPDSYETFPSWSPDGRFLYFCSAKYHPYKDYKNIRYDLLRIPFNAATEKFGIVDTVISASKNSYSISFPRVSPDGKYLMYCHTAYGSFTIWHDDSDLNILNLENGTIDVPDINSNRSESYHTWSSNGRWVVFSSRRINGLYTHLYITYFDNSGKSQKPFLLPQKNPDKNNLLLKSYNIPELVKSKIRINPREFATAIRSDGAKATFVKAE
jgi:hypothetical protein